MSASNADAINKVYKTSKIGGACGIKKQTRAMKSVGLLSERENLRKDAQVRDTT